MRIEPLFLEGIIEYSHSLEQKLITRAQNNCSESCYLLARFHQLGFQRPINKQLADQYFQKSFLLGNPYAGFYLIDIDRQETKNEFVENLLVLFQDRLRNGDIEAAHFIGLIYCNIDLALDYNKAIEYFEIAANDGISSSMLEMSELYELNLDNSVKSNEWLIKSAKAGNPIARRRLGVKYAHGEINGFEDYAEAAKWYWLTLESLENYSFYSHERKTSKSYFIEETCSDLSSIFGSLKSYSKPSPITEDMEFILEMVSKTNN